MTIQNSLAQIDEIRDLCETQRARLAAMSRGDRSRSGAMGVLMLAEDALKIQLDIHKLLLRLASRGSASNTPTTAAPSKPVVPQTGTSSNTSAPRFAPHPLRRKGDAAGGSTQAKLPARRRAV